MDIRPHAYDPVLHPELFDGILGRRIVAFLIDFIVIVIPVFFGFIFILVFGLMTFGLGWMLLWLLSPLTVLWAIAYYGWTLGSPASATLGMRVMELQMRTWYGEPAYFVLGAVHVILFYASVTFLTPLILLVGLFNDRNRLLHDIVLGAIVIRTPPFVHPPR